VVTIIYSSGPYDAVYPGAIINPCQKLPTPLTSTGGVTIVLELPLECVSQPLLQTQTHHGQRQPSSTTVYQPKSQEDMEEEVWQQRWQVELPNDMVFTCNTDDINIVEAHIWCANGGGYVVTHIFHNMVMNQRPGLITVHPTQALLESIMTNMVIIGPQCGKMRKGTSIQNHILQIDMEMTMPKS